MEITEAPGDTIIKEGPIGIFIGGFVFRISMGQCSKLAAGTCDCVPCVFRIYSRNARVRTFELLKAGFLKMLSFLAHLIKKLSFSLAFLKNVAHLITESPAFLTSLLTCLPKATFSKVQLFKSSKVAHP